MDRKYDIKNEESEDFTVEMILKKRFRDGNVEYFVKWNGYPDTDNTWEPEQLLSCPDLIRRFNAQHTNSGPFAVKKEKTSPSVVNQKKQTAAIKEEKREVMAIENNDTSAADVKPVRKLQTGRPSIIPRNKVKVTKSTGDKKQAGVKVEVKREDRVDMKPLPGPVVCKRPFSFELGVEPVAVSGFSMQKGNELFYLIAYPDGQEWTPSEWAERDTGISRILLPYYEQILRELNDE